MTAVIEPAKFPEQVEEVRAILLEYGASLGFALCFQSFDQELAGLPGPYAPPIGNCLVANRAGTIDGIVALKALAPGVCEMKRLYIRPAARGTGLGGRLAEAIVRSARDLGYRAMRLDTVPQMRAAQHIYERLGFTDIPPYYASPVADSRFMELRL